MFAYITGSFWPIFCGSVILASSAPFGFSAIGLIAKKWFPEDQRATVTAIIGLADVAGLTATFAIQEILCDRVGFFKQEATFETIRQETYDIMVFEGLLIISIAFFVIVTTKEKPKKTNSRDSVLRQD